MSEVVKDTEELPLSDREKLTLALVQSQLREAEAVLQLRKMEAQSVVSEIQRSYEADGKFEVTTIDVGKGAITRRAV